MKIWFDITNTPHVHFFAPIIEHLKKEHEIMVTARDFSETLPLLKSYGINYTLIGNHKGKSKVKKVLGLITRIISMIKDIPEFDVSFGIGGQNTTPVCAVRRKPAVVFTDNDTSYKWHSYKLGTYFVFPTYFNFENVMKKFGVKREQILLYDGFKEDIYMASYSPNPSFLDQLPFKEFITIRPENLKANYVPKDAITIVPKLFEVFKDQNILFLPRYVEEREYANGFSNIFIPDGVLPGKDVCFYTKAMLTGAGTFAREAALLGTPAVSFFPGKEFLTVDKIMQEKGWQFKSRDPNEIKEFLKTATKESSRLEQSKVVLDDLLSKLEYIINEVKNK
jgi:predicted glycosyltransferase